MHDEVADRTAAVKAAEDFSPVLCRGIYSIDRRFREEEGGGVEGV